MDAVLNLYGVPTAKGGKWSRQQVYRLLKPFQFSLDHAHHQKPESIFDAAGFWWFNINWKGSNAQSSAIILHIR